jgi:hypothetical protein
VSELRVVHIGQPSEAALRAAAQQVEMIRRRCIDQVLQAAKEQRVPVTREFIGKVLGIPTEEVHFRSSVSSASSI